MSNTESVSRRKFMGSAALAGAAVSFPNVLTAESKGKEVIRFALIGCGGRGKGAAAQVMNSPHKTECVALADAFMDTAKGAQNYLKHVGHEDKLKVTDDTIFAGLDAYKKVMEMDNVDLVLLTTSPGFRPLHFEHAVNKGKHVFMEKPVATDGAGVRRVLAANEEAKKKNLMVTVGLQRHHEDNYIETVKRIQDGAIGDLNYARVFWNSGGVWVKPREKDQTELEYQMRNWYYFNWLCGDHIVEQHIHNIDVANWFIGANPISAQGMGGREVRKGIDHGQIYDHHFVEYTYPDGQIIASQCRHQKGCMNRVEEVFQGTKGSVTINSANFALMKNKRKKTIYDHQGEDDINPYQQEHNDLFKAIRLGQYKINDTKQGADATLSAIIGRMATYSGQVITWDEAIKMDQNLVPDLYSFDDEAPVQPDENGMYPIPIPGVTKY